MKLQKKKMRFVLMMNIYKKCLLQLKLQMKELFPIEVSANAKISSRQKHKEEVTPQIKITEEKNCDLMMNSPIKNNFYLKLQKKNELLFILVLNN